LIFDSKKILANGFLPIKLKGLTIIFIRYKIEEVSEIIENLILILKELKSRTEDEFEFITIKIRRRKI